MHLACGKFPIMTLEAQGWLAGAVIEFYKKGCQEKSSPSTGRREDFCLEIQPTACECAPRFAREVRCGLFAYPWLLSSSGDDANRVFDFASGPWYFGVYHGSI